MVVGVSAGGINALIKLLGTLSKEFSLPLIIVQHLSPRYENYLVDILSKQTLLTVMEAEEKEKIKAGNIYIAAPNYHLLIESDKTFSLSVDEHVCFSRPSIDVLFETASFAYGNKLIGVILTGANKDGASGLKAIQDRGGLAVVQNPETAEVNSMPKAALELTQTQHVFNIHEIGHFLSSINS